jgi:nicotinamide-nucleotide amidase
VTIELLEQIITKLRDRKQTLGFAESCTGGCLSQQITMIPGVSDVYQGAVVSYANQVKEKLLGVSPQTLAAFGAVSESAVIEMAKGARHALGCDWSVAISGIAGPSGGSVDKPVGTVWVAVSGPRGEMSEKKKFDGSRTEIQRQSAHFAANFLLNCLGH